MSGSKDKPLGDTPPESQALNGAAAPAATSAETAPSDAAPAGPAPARFSAGAGYGRPPQGAYRIDPSVLNAGRTRPVTAAKTQTPPRPATPAPRAPIPDAPRSSPIYGGSLVPPPRARPAVPSVESRPVDAPAPALKSPPATPAAAPASAVAAAASPAVARASARPAAPAHPGARAYRAEIDIPEDRIVPRAPEGGASPAPVRSERTATVKPRTPARASGGLTPLLVGAGLVAALVAIVAVVLLVRGPRKPTAPAVVAPVQAAASPVSTEVTPADPTVRGLVIPDPSLLPAPARSYNAPPVTTVVAPAPTPIPSRPVPGPAPLAAPPPAAQPAAAAPANLPPPDIAVQPPVETARPPPAPKPRPSIPVLSDTVPPK